MHPGLARFLALNGRAGRGEYWATVLLISVIATFPMVLLVFGLDLAPAPRLAAATVVSLVFCLASVPVCVRRLHDRGKPAGWVAPFVLIPWVLTNLAATPAADGEVWGDLAHLTGLVLAIWGLVEIGLRRGEAGENRFGPPAQAPAVA